MEVFKSKKEVLGDYFYDVKEIWNEVCTLRDMSNELLEWVCDMYSNPEKYNGGWKTQPNFLAGHTYIILNKISALAEKITTEDIDIFTE
jgi:hypothetical protein